MVFKKGMALSSLHARQLIVHGHVAVGDRIITVPGYEVRGTDEGVITLVGGAPPKEAEPTAEAQAEAVKHEEEAKAEHPAEVK